MGNNKLIEKPPTPIIIKNTGGSILKYSAIAVGSLILFSVIKKKIKEAGKGKYLEEAGTDPNVQIAMKIYDEIPDKYTDDLTINPVSWVQKIWNETKSLVTSIDSEKVIALGAKITDFDKVKKAFFKIYNLDMLEILEEAMDKEDYLIFITAAKSDNTPYESIETNKKGNYVFPKKKTIVYRRRFIRDSTTTKMPGNFKIAFEPISADTSSYCGIATGKKYYLKDYKKYFWETSLKGSSHTYSIYIPTEETKFLNGTEFNAKNLKSLSVQILPTEIFTK